MSEEIPAIAKRRKINAKTFVTAGLLVLSIFAGLGAVSTAFAQQESVVKAHSIEDEVVNIVTLDEASLDNTSVLTSSDQEPTQGSQQVAKTGVSSLEAQPFSFDTLTKVVSSLLIVICSIFVAAFFYKRFVPSGFTTSDGLRVVESISIGGRERLIIVEVTGRRFLLSSGTAGTQSIAELDSRNERLREAPAKQDSDMASQSAEAPLKHSRVIVADTPTSTWKAMLRKRFASKPDAASEQRCSRPYTDVEKLKHYALDSLAAERS